VRNVTDVDDKIINRAKELKIPWLELSRKFEREYLSDMKTLNINGVTKYARATAHIKEIISQVKRLLKGGFAYQIEDGIYYDISKFKDYGKLSRRTALMAEDAVSRIDESKGKRNKGDFCLWKFSKSGELKWTPPTHHPIIKAGRPGWHIEDTAITEKYFGAQYDIHGGARDLIFPHHEAEIAQMEATSGKKPMVKYWLHTGFLTVKGRKMAKSLKNFVTIRDFLKKYSARILRFFVLSAHYRSQIDYSENKIGQIKNQLERIDEFVTKLKTQSSKLKTTTQNLKLDEVKKAFKAAMEDDFNTPKAFAVIFDLINKGNSLIVKNKMAPADAREILKFFRKIDKVFNFIFWGRPKKKFPKEILKLVKEREKYRQEGQWKLADEIRQKIKKMGYWVEDTKKGPEIKRL